MKKWIILIGLLLVFGAAWHVSSLGYTYVDHRMSKRPDTGKLLWPQNYLVSAIITKNKAGYSLQNPDKTITLAIRDASIDQFADDCLGEEMDVAFTVEPQWFLGRKNHISKFHAAILFREDMTKPGIKGLHKEDKYGSVICFLEDSEHLSRQNKASE